MADSDYIPGTDAALVLWYQNFALKFASYSTALGFVAADVTAVNNDYAMLKYLVDLAEAYKAEAKERVQYKDTIIKGKIGTPTPVAPANPTIAPPAVLTATGIVARVRLLANRIKAAPAYTSTIGKDLGIVAPETPPNPNAKPKGGAVAIAGSQVTLKFTKAGFDGVQIETQRGSEMTWVQLDKALRSPYTDTRPPLVANAPEIRRYRLRFLKGNEMVGILSDVLTVTTVP